MNTMDELVTSVLRDEAQDAPGADAFVNRMLGELDTLPRHPRFGPRRTWDAPAAAAAVAVAVLIITAAVLSSFWLSRSTTDRGNVTTPPTVTTPSVSAGPTIPPANAGRLPGWLSLTSGSVHIEMDANASDGAWWKSWTVGCPLSVLGYSETGEYACAGEAGEQPRYEVMVAPGLTPMTMVNEHINWHDPLRPTRLHGELDHVLCGGKCVISVGGQVSEIRSTTADVRYNCPGSCGSVADRVVTVISFPDFDAHVTILSPPGENLSWLTDFVYVDPTG